MSMRSSSEPAAVDASRGASLAAAAAASRPSSSARARLTRRAPLLRLRSPDVRGGPAGRGARRGRPVESPRSAPRAFTGPRHAARPGSRRVAIVVSAARVPRVCALTHATSPFFLEETTPAKINDRGGRRSDGTVNPRDERGARGANFSREKRRAARRDPGSRIARAFTASNWGKTLDVACKPRQPPGPRTTSRGEQNSPRPGRNPTPDSTAVHRTTTQHRATAFPNIYSPALTELRVAPIRVYPRIG